MMEHTRLSRLLSTAFLIGLLAVASAAIARGESGVAPRSEALDPLGGVAEARASSTLLLRNSSSGACASGVAVQLASGSRGILTNWHVYRALCPLGDCSEVAVLRSSSIGAIPKVVSLASPLSLARGFGSADLAFLGLKPPFSSEVSFVELGLATASQVGKGIALLGFPGCRTLEVSRGAVTKLVSTEIETGAWSHAGGSGGPIFDGQGQLLGILSRASMSASAFASLLANGSAPTHAIPASLAARYLDLPAEQTPQAEAQTLVDWYRSNSPFPSSLDGLVQLTEFFARVDGLRDALLATNPSSPGDAARFSALLGRYPGATFSRDWVGAKPLEVDQPLLHLAFLYNFQQHGVRSSLFSPLSPGENLLALRVYGRSWALAEADFEAGGATSLRDRAVRLGLWLLGGAVLYFLSLGWVFGRTPGRFLWRLGVAALVALTWPISLGFWMAFSRARPRRD